MGIGRTDQSEAFEKPAEHGKQGIDDRQPQGQEGDHDAQDGSSFISAFNGDKGKAVA
jgi:hypothetical protein